MSCECEHKRLASEKDRIRRLAKAFAVSEGLTVVLYQTTDGTYSFGAENKGKLIEIITPF